MRLGSCLKPETPCAGSCPPDHCLQDDICVPVKAVCNGTDGEIELIDPKKRNEYDCPPAIEKGSACPVKCEGDAINCGGRLQCDDEPCGRQCVREADQKCGNKCQSKEVNMTESEQY